MGKILPGLLVGVVLSGALGAVAPDGTQRSEVGGARSQPGRVRR